MWPIFLENGGFFFTEIDTPFVGEKDGATRSWKNCLFRVPKILYANVMRDSTRSFQYTDDDQQSRMYLLL